MRSPNGDLSFLAVVGRKWKLPNGEKSKAFNIKIGRLVSHVEHYATFIFFLSLVYPSLSQLLVFWQDKQQWAQRCLTSYSRRKDNARLLLHLKNLLTPPIKLDK